MTTKQKQHTPGPWKLVGTNQHRILARFENGSDEYHAEIATVTMGQGGAKLYPEMGEANARLIAAAPAMLEALELAESILNYAWRTVDAICGANHKEPLPIESLPEDRQEMVYELVRLLADNGEQIAAALRKARDEEGAS